MEIEKRADAHMRHHCKILMNPRKFLRAFRPGTMPQLVVETRRGLGAFPSRLIVLIRLRLDIAATVVMRLIICATPVCVVLLRCTPQFPVENVLELRGDLLVVDQLAEVGVGSLPFSVAPQLGCERLEEGPIHLTERSDISTLRCLSACLVVVAVVALQPFLRVDEPVP